MNVSAVLSIAPVFMEASLTMGGDMDGETLSLSMINQGPTIAFVDTE